MIDNAEFQGRIALVTGGGRGIGAGIAMLLAQHGATVAVNYAKDAASADETVAGIRAAGGEAKAYGADISDAEANAAMVDAIRNDFGHIDLLVNNAGVASRGRAVVDTAPDEALRLLNTHAVGPHHLCRLVLPGMRERATTTNGRGDIVFISSVATDSMSAYGAPYNMGKAAMEALALTLAKEEVRNNIHVNIAAPGLVVSEMGRRLAKAGGFADIHELDSRFPFGRVCEPEDVARVVVFLCSSLSGYVTGERIRVHGGGQSFRD